MKRTVRGRTPANAPQVAFSAVENGSSVASASTDGPAQPPSSTSDCQRATEGRTVVTSFVAVGAHLFWIFAGPAVLALLLIAIALRRTAEFSAVDIAYFLVAGAVLACRWIDQRTGQATTGTGELATWADFRRYAVRLPPASLGIWILVKLVAGFLG
jgi:hypothetical protein